MKARIGFDLGARTSLIESLLIKKIAAELGISQNTAKKRIRNLWPVPIPTPDTDNLWWQHAGPLIEAVTTAFLDESDFPLPEGVDATSVKEQIRRLVSLPGRTTGEIIKDIAAGAGISQNTAKKRFQTLFRELMSRIRPQ
ncbi:MAG: hypothetical protein L0Y58_05670 [Verrucomicrobia subdivision 3 bacterium]|nr:hypothetical protein [Limisphaerales bacterium]